MLRRPEQPPPVTSSPPRLAFPPPFAPAALPPRSAAGSHANRIRSHDADPSAAGQDGGHRGRKGGQTWRAVARSDIHHLELNTLGRQRGLGRPAARARRSTEQGGHRRSAGRLAVPTGCPASPASAALCRDDCTCRESQTRVTDRGLGLCRRLAVRSWGRPFGAGLRFEPAAEKSSIPGEAGPEPPEADWPRCKRRSA